jgi:two-component system, NtrC family, response regulator HydG
MNNTQSTVVIIDDDMDICSNMADILADLGHVVETAHDGQAALELIRRRPFDVALIDLKMPGMDGLALYREIKKLRTETAAFLVTAHATDRDTEEALALGILGVLDKPLDVPKLLSTLQLTD